MTHPSNQTLDHARQNSMHGISLSLASLPVVMLVVLVWAGTSCCAQHIVYPSENSGAIYSSAVHPSVAYPTVSGTVVPHQVPTYPAQSFPVEQSTIVRSGTQFPISTYADSRVVYPSSVAHDSTTAKTTDASFDARHDRTTLAAPTPYQTPTALQSGTVARLAANRSYNTMRQSQRSRPMDAVLPPPSQETAYEHHPFYSQSMVESARHNAARARRIAQSASPIVASIASENAGLADRFADLTESYLATSSRVATAQAKLNATTRDFEDVHAKLANYGLTPTVGLLLRHKREQLDAWQVEDSRTLFASQELKRLRQQQLELEMTQYDGSEPDSQTNEILTAAGIDVTAVGRDTTSASQIRGLLLERHQWLGSLQKGYQDYQQKLGELDSVTTASTDLTNDYRNLIDRHVTWIRSGEPLSVRDVRNLQGGLAAMFDSRRSHDLGFSLTRKMESNPASGIFLVALQVLILLIRWRAKAWLVGVGTLRRMRDATADSRKLVASVLTVVVSLAIPSLLYSIAHWLGTGFVSESTLYASSGFYAASLIALLIEVPRQLLRTDGYLEKHVDIELPRRLRATRYLTLIGIGLVLAAYVVTKMGLIDHGMWRDSVSRFGFMAAMLLVAWTAHLSLKPTGGFLEPLIAKFGGRVIHRVRFLIYLLGIGFPLAMAVLSALGYGFTANELIKRAIIALVSALIAATLWSGTKIVSASVWQMMTGSSKPERQFDEYGVLETEQVIDANGSQYLELKHQLAFLCQCGLVLAAIVSFGWLWIDIFPNLRLGNPVMWTVQDTVSGTSLDADGQAITNSVVETTEITALHLLLAAATLFVAFQLAKLLPALFDALVLQRVSFDEGMEHFSLVLGRCLLFGIGCFIACKWLGVRWQAIQWLAVGLTIGLGFGLADMVRNLFGGLIVLFEKPARLGDLITVGRVTGRVAAQKLRTTVLSDDDGREVIIPNKNFVNEDVVNWMGAGKLSVIPIEVAVTREERPADICRSLQELVIDQQHVLLTPTPQATLVCVGKTSQRIEIRAWIEEDQNASQFRESLLQCVRTYLRGRKLLAPSQPSQPVIPAPSESAIDSNRSRSNRDRKRSA